MSLRFVTSNELAVHDVEAEEVVEEGVLADEGGGVGVGAVGVEEGIHSNLN